jgi:hypothetical protein
MEKYEMHIITNDNQIYILDEYVCITITWIIYSILYA